MKKKHRYFRIGERVFVCTERTMNFGTILSINGREENGVIGESDCVNVNMRETNGTIVAANGESIYKIAPRISKKVGEIVCYEHHTFERGHNYPFYMPSNDENYYRFELGL